VRSPAPLPEVAAELDSAVRAEVTRQHLVGLSAAVIQGARVVWSGAAGFADLATGVAATPATDYLWFSMTKIVTATAAMRLVDRRLLDLDRPVAQYLTAFRTVRAGEAVTVRHLLSHSAGLANPVPVRWVRPATAPAPDQAEFTATQLKRLRRPRFRPGTRASYTNLGYVVLGEVIAAASGKPYAEYVRDHVLRPLGMAHTAFAYDPTRTSQRATTYQRLPRVLAPLLAPLLGVLLPPGIVGERRGELLAYRPFLVSGAAYGGLVGSVEEAALLVAAHLGGGTVGENEVLAPETVQTMQQIRTRGRPFDVGLGWFRSPAAQHADPAYVEHLGGGLGIYNVMRIYPDLRLGIVLMANAPGYDYEAVLQRLLQVIEHANPGTRPNRP
jgi:CubicO group peptidase (beta-lactamase class C family)